MNLPAPAVPKAIAMSRIDANQVERAMQWLARWIEEGRFRSISAEVGVRGEAPVRRALGVAVPERDQATVEDTVFLIASPTKPVTALAIMQLVERGMLDPSQPVSHFLPEFGSQGKDQIRIGHLLTHSSGLPDFVPQNEPLRRQHAPLTTFLEHVCRLPLGYRPGTAYQYQSTGFLVLAALVKVVTGQTLPDFLQEHVLTPLGLRDTSLGAPDAWYADGKIDHVAQIRLPPERDTDWGWNSRYWRQLGAPWGGLLASASDLGRLCAHLLEIHHGQAGILRPATLAAMTANQSRRLGELAPELWRTRPWGYGWQHAWHSHPRGLGCLLSPGAYGHWGATGTLLWIDPQREAYMVLLTTEPLAWNRHEPLQFSNAVAAAIV
ncbi:MAG: hypothetical protein CMJ59_17285 [Planctomycetaceae bacterium]|nr:hypothetical protein [Planctomycetaceae bacterium]